MKYLLWDFDETLAYRDGNWNDAVYELLNEYGYTYIKLDEIRSYLKSGFLWHTPEISHEELLGDKKWWEYMNNYFEDIFKKIGIENNVASHISSFVREKYLKLDKWHVYDDTVSCLRSAMEKNYTNIILSNHIPELEELVENLGLKDYFAKIYSSAHLGFEKPNKKAYEKVLIELKDAESITMIGDSYIADVQGGKGAGIESILVRKSNDYNYDKYFATLSQLADFL